MLRRLIYVALAAGALAALVLATGGMIGVSVPARATAVEVALVDAAPCKGKATRSLPARRAAR